MVREAQLWCRRSRKLIPAWVNSQLENFLFQPTSKWAPFWNQGRIRQQRERDRLCFHMLCPRHSGPLSPTCPIAARLWATFTFFEFTTCTLSKTIKIYTFNLLIRVCIICASLLRGIKLVHQSKVTFNKRKTTSSYLPFILEFFYLLVRQRADNICCLG